VKALVETERLVLRRPREDDADAFAEYLADPEVMRFLGGETVPRENVPSVVARWLAAWEADGFGKLVVEARDTATVLGRVGINIFDTRGWRHSTQSEAGDHAQPELGWTFIRRHWGHGYATEAALAVRAWARRELGIGRLISLISADNARSQRVAERLGAVPGDTVSLADGGPHVAWVHP
jgi:RimJ/RimL family protein N-acetyltransferase